MATREEPDEVALEQELQEHLLEQRASLTALVDALACDPVNEELLAVHGELCIAIKGAEESLLELKRARLLREIDAVIDARASESKVSQEEPYSFLNGTPHKGSSIFMVGSKCRFRHSDGRWYNGHVIELDTNGYAHVSFLTPTIEKMQMCKFYLQQRCRFGGNCRMSHGSWISVDALKQFYAPTWQQSSVGSAVLACNSTEGQELWRRAELETWDEIHQRGTVIFVDDGSRFEVGMENIYESEFAEVSDEDGISSGDGEGESEGGEEGVDYYCASFGAIIAAETGPQTETVTFANWERHTRGMASKMMANMGYREGMGLGRSGQGIVAPLQVRVLPKHLSLDFVSDALERGEGTGNGKRKSRGGRRKRDRKLAEAARAAKAEEGMSPDVFGFLNNQLASQSHSESEDMRFSRRELQSQRSVKEKSQKEARQSLIAQADEVTELRNKVDKLQEMAVRNRKDKAVYEAVSRKLDESRKALVKAEADHASASMAVHRKEKEKKWLRF